MWQLQMPSWVVWEQQRVAPSSMALTRERRDGVKAVPPCCRRAGLPRSLPDGLTTVDWTERSRSCPISHLRVHTRLPRQLDRALGYFGSVAETGSYNTDNAWILKRPWTFPYHMLPVGLGSTAQSPPKSRRHSNAAGSPYDQRCGRSSGEPSGKPFGKQSGKHVRPDPLCNRFSRQPRPRYDQWHCC